MKVEGSAIGADAEKTARLAHDATLAVFGEVSTCILTSHALAHFVRTGGGNPELVRVTARAWPEGRCGCHGWQNFGVVLGSPGGGARRPASAPGMWKGHLAVACDGWLLDATLPQVNRPAGADCRDVEIELAPAAVRLPPGWRDGEAVSIRAGTTVVSWQRYRRQAGWRSAADARPSHWRPVFDAMWALSR